MRKVPVQVRQETPLPCASAGEEAGFRRSGSGGAVAPRVRRGVSGFRPDSSGGACAQGDLRRRRTLDAGKGGATVKRLFVAVMAALLVAACAPRTAPEVTIYYFYNPT